MELLRAAARAVPLLDRLVGIVVVADAQPPVLEPELRAAVVRVVAREVEAPPARADAVALDPADPEFVYFRARLIDNVDVVKQDGKAVIVMCSALGQESLVMEAIEAGASDFIVKPFKPAKVVEVAQKVLAAE